MRTRWWKCLGGFLLFVNLVPVMVVSWVVVGGWCTGTGMGIPWSSPGGSHRGDLGQKPEVVRIEIVVPERCPYQFSVHPDRFRAVFGPGSFQLDVRREKSGERQLGPSGALVSPTSSPPVGSLKP